MSERERIHVAGLGDAPGAAELRRALGEHPDVEVVGWFEGLEQARELLATVDVDAVLVAAADASALAADAAAVRSHTGAPVILLAPPDAPTLLEHALGAGVDDALLLPQPAESVLFAVRKATALPSRERAPAARESRVTTVFSPKGGTGKSATATNLAALLASEFDARTLLVDLDLQFGDDAIMLGLSPARTLYDLVSDPGALDPEKLGAYTVRHESGLDLLAAPARPEEAESVPAARIASVLEVARSSYDAVVVDCSPFLHGPVLSAIDVCDDLLLIAALDVPTLKDVRQSLETLELLHVPPDLVSLVLNRADAPVGMKRAEVEAALGRRFRFTLPDDRGVQLAVNRGAPLVMVDRRSPFVESLRRLARALLASPVRSRAAEGDAVPAGGSA